MDNFETGFFRKNPVSSPTISGRSAHSHRAPTGVYRIDREITVALVQMTPALGDTKPICAK